MPKLVKRGTYSAQIRCPIQCSLTPKLRELFGNGHLRVVRRVGARFRAGLITESAISLGRTQNDRSRLLVPDRATAGVEV
jgi:hypothetical protein